MIISNTHNFVFVHLEKCGGTSVEMALDPYVHPRDIVLGSSKYGSDMQHTINKRFGEDWVKKEYLWKHSTLQQVHDVHGTSGYFKWAVVRNPYDLMYSLWKFSKAHPSMNEQYVFVARKTGTFPRFVRHMLKTGHQAVAPQVDRLSINGKFSADLVVDLAVLNDDWGRVCDTVGIKAPPLPWANKTHSRRPRHEDGDTKRLIEKHFERDYDTFGAFHGV